ncbi:MULTISPECIES: hypothetical protein [unclassified Microcoleus]|uniref:hypothetical protein n=1 Tax=unclassified Microcoleus TaxID=2642155 RepID=UPI002FD53A52
MVSATKNVNSVGRGCYSWGFFQQHSTLLTIIFDDRRLGEKPWEIQGDRPLFSLAQILI